MKKHDIEYEHGSPKSPAGRRREAYPQFYEPFPLYFLSPARCAFYFRSVCFAHSLRYQRGVRRMKNIKKSGSGTTCAVILSRHYGWDTIALPSERDVNSSGGSLPPPRWRNADFNPRVISAILAMKLTILFDADAPIIYFCSRTTSWREARSNR